MSDLSPLRSQKADIEARRVHAGTFDADQCDATKRVQYLGAETLPPSTNFRSSQATGIFMSAAPDPFIVQRSSLQTIISQDKVAQDFLGIANVL